MRSNGTAKAGRPYDVASVLAIAVDTFNTYGYEATSMGVLAEKLGTSKSAVYYHVSGKEELLRLALDNALGGLEGILEDPRASSGPADARLEFVLREAVTVLTARLPFVTLLLRVRGNTEVERQAIERRRRFDHTVAELVDQARAEGTIRRDVDSGTTTRLLFGMINSIVEWYRPHGPVSADKLADDVVAVAFDGIRDLRGHVR